MLPIQLPAGFRIIAHRGASGYAPENSAAAFLLAREMGAREIEFDVQLSSDKVLVLCHDRTLERYGHGPVVVEELSSQELLSLDMGSWYSPFFYPNEPMITLSQLFEEYGRQFIYHLEMKGQAAELPEQVYQAISKYKLQTSCVVRSFSYEQLKSLRDLAPDWPLAWLVKSIDAEVIEKARAIGISQLCPHSDSLSPESVELARSVAEEIIAWDISGTPEEVSTLAKKMVQVGCDGLTIDWPDWFVSH